MHIAIVEVVIIAGKIPAAVVRQGKVMEIGLGQAHLPVLVIGLMVAHQRGKGDAVNDTVHTMEPGLPLGVVFAIVHDVAHVDEKGRIGVAPRRRLSQIFPVAVIAGLGVGEYQALEGLSSGSFETVPIAGMAFRHQTIFVVRFRGKVFQPGQILQVLHAIIGEKVFLCGNCQRIMLPLEPVLHLRLGKPAGRLPHQHPAGGGIRCHQLPQESGLQVFGQSPYAGDGLPVERSLGKVSTAGQQQPPRGNPFQEPAA